MSCAGYESEILPDARSRRVVAALLAVAAAAGAALLVSLPVSSICRGALLALWIGTAWAEARRFRRATSRVERIVMSADGRLRGGVGDDLRYPLELLPGSVVGRRMAWLRLRFEDGLSWGELVTERRGGREAWRRLRVIWRHRGHFGRPSRS